MLNGSAVQSGLVLDFHALKAGEKIQQLFVDPSFGFALRFVGKTCGIVKASQFLPSMENISPDLIEEILNVVEVSKIPAQRRFDFA